MHHRHPHFDVADTDAVVDALAALSLAIPRSDVRRAQLELQRGRHAVQRIEPIGLVRLSVRVQVDEARGDDEASGVDRVSAAYRFARDDGDASALEPDIADRIEVSGRIDDATAENDAVVDGRCA